MADHIYKVSVARYKNKKSGYKTIYLGPDFNLALDYYYATDKSLKSKTSRDGKVFVRWNPYKWRNGQ